VLEIAPDTLVEFRVTSLDATHGFAVYNPTGAIIAQTQAMPGYINRLSVRFDEPGSYAVLCLEFCGMAHHNMRSVILVDAGEPGHKKDLATE
jgi:cytochrome c oxidase subunit 2